MRILITIGALMLAGCATTEAVVAPSKSITLTEPFSWSNIRMLPGEYRNTLRQGDTDLYIGVGATSWPHSGLPDPAWGLCLKSAEPTYFGIFAPTLGTCVKVDRPASVKQG